VPRGKSVTIIHWRVTAADEATMTMTTRVLGEDGSVIAEAPAKPARWDELGHHATFPSAIAATGLREALPFARNFHGGAMIAGACATSRSRVYNKNMFKELGAAIATERTRQGLRVGDLGVDSQVVEGIEAGKPGITTTQLEKIASALQIDAMALRAGEIRPRPQPSVYLRHRGNQQDFTAADAPLLDSALEHARARNALARLVGDDVGIFPSHKLETRGVAADATNAPAHQAYQLARELRRVLGNDADSLADLRDLAESRCGVTVLVRRLSTIGSSAFAVKAADEAAIVLAPLTHSREPFARLWIAHELCHLLFDVDAGGVHVVVDFDDELHVQQAERRARAFAAELLLPEAGLRKLMGPPAGASGEVAARNLVAMARDAFGSTWQVAANHLCNLGFISMGLREWLERQEPSAMTRPWATTLPMEGAPSVHVMALTRRAYDAGYLTDGEVRALLDIDLLSPLPWEG
jgi:Zn-dependent peptidase ImmA (M78 family)